MRVLFLSPYVPYPVRAGGRMRVLGLIRCLASFASVRVLAAGDPRSDEAALSRDRLQSEGIRLDVFQPTGPGAPESDGRDTHRPPDALAHFRCPDLFAALPAILDELGPDLVHFEELVMAQYASAVSCPRVLDRQKVEWAYHDALAEAGGPAAAEHRREAARFRLFDSRMAGQFARILVAGEGDRRLLQSLHGDLIEVVPNGIDDALQSPVGRPARIDHVLLYGALDYAPNAEANERYFRDIWPALSRALPELRTVVVGSGTPQPWLEANSRVDLRGWVEDIAPVLTGPGVLVVSVRVGGGTRTKILEAMAAGMPVVSTAIGVENLDLEPGRHYLPAETAEETVAAVVRLVREPALAESISREGAAIAAAWRWSAIGRRLQTIYEGLKPPRATHSTRARPRALLVGVRPLPDEQDARGLSFPGHRTAQFRFAIERAGLDAVEVLLDEDPGAPARAAGASGSRHVLLPEAFRGGQQLQRLHDRFAPDVIVAAGGYHPARAASLLSTEAARLVDLPGDLAAEGQARARLGGDAVLSDFLSVLSVALLAGDRWTVVGPSQRLAVLGQLGLCGRMTGDRIGEQPVCVMPLAAEGPQSMPPVQDGPLRVLWSGGYNTWMDEGTLFAALQKAMEHSPELTFVSTGGAIVGHDEDSHARFWARARQSPLSSRFCDLGRLTRRETLSILEGCHVVLAISRDCLEAELGSRQRLVEALAHGRPVITTALGDLAGEIGQARAGWTLPPGDSAGLAELLVRLGADRALLAASAARAWELWRARFTYTATVGCVVDWLQQPRRWSRSGLDGGTAGRLAADRVRLQSELDAIRGSCTFRALRVLDRLLGRA